MVSFREFFPIFHMFRYYRKENWSTCCREVVSLSDRQCERTKDFQAVLLSLMTPFVPFFQVRDKLNLCVGLNCVITVIYCAGVPLCVYLFFFLYYPP